MQRTLGFDKPVTEIRAEWLSVPSLRGFNLQEAEGTLRQVLAYRVWFDQQRGWRYTNPNLEQLDMVRVGYLGLDELASDDELSEDVGEVGATNRFLREREVARRWRCSVHAA